MERTEAIRPVASHGFEVKRQVVCRVGVLDMDDGSPTPAVLLDTADAASLRYVTDLLSTLHDGHQTFPRTSPSLHFGDNQIDVIFYRFDKTNILCEVTCKATATWLSHNFVFRSFVSADGFNAFQELFNILKFFYLLPALREVPDFEEIILPKYRYQVINLRAVAR